MPIAKAQERIPEAVIQWDGVAAQPHRFGGIEYVIGKRELGHIHGNHLVDIPFPKRVRDEIIHAGLARKHHVLPNSGWVSFYLVTEEDVPSAIVLLKRSYDLAMQQRRRRTG